MKSTARERRIAILRVLCCLKGSQLKAFLNTADSWLVKVICECALNTLRGNIPLTAQQKQRLRKHARLIRSLASDKGTWHGKKRLIVQKGSGGVFLPLLLAPLVEVLARKLFEKIQHGARAEDGLGASRAD